MELLAIGHDYMATVGADVFARSLRLKEASKYLSIGTKQLRRLIRAGEIPVIGNTEGSGGVWLIDREDADRWVERSKTTLLGFLATTNLSATPHGPAYLSRVASGSLFMITAGASRVASGLLCLHAIAITPASPMELVRSLISLWPARSRSRLATLSIESSDSFVASAAASIATGWNEPVPGREFHPLKSSAFSRRTVTPV